MLEFRFPHFQDPGPPKGGHFEIFFSNTALQTPRVECEAYLEAGGTPSVFLQKKSRQQLPASRENLGQPLSQGSRSGRKQRMALGHGRTRHQREVGGSLLSSRQWSHVTEGAQAAETEQGPQAAHRCVLGPGRVRFS